MLVEGGEGSTKDKSAKEEIETKNTIEKANGTTSWFFVKISNIDKPLARLLKREERGLNQEQKRKSLQLTPRKHEGPEETTANNYEPTLGQPRRNGKIPRNLQSPKTESERNGKSE